MVLNKEDIDFFDKLIKKYDVELISAVNDGISFDVKKLIIIMLLKLEQKGKIEIKNNQINVLDKNEFGLSEIEIYIIKKIINGKVKIENKYALKHLIYEEGKKSGLFICLKEYLKQKYIKLEKCLNIFIVIFILASIFVTEIISDMMFSGYTIIIFYLVVRFVLSFLFSELNEDIIYVRTGMGEDIAKRLDNLDECMLLNNDDGFLNNWENIEEYKLILGFDKEIMDKMSNLINIEYEKL